jgi:N-acetylmuramoyl-L-alanine amidase
MEKEQMPLIIIDPGHGGRDPGACASGLQEKELNLQIGLALKNLLPQDGLEAGLTREDDTFIGLNHRCELANNSNADLFLSVHLNAAGDDKAQGMEVFHFPASERGEKLAFAVYRELLSLGRKGRGVRAANYFVLKHARMPACLVECGFITNADEAEWLEDNIPAIAAALQRGIKNFVGLKPRRTGQ